MRRRLSKKLHRRHLDDVIDISQSSAWRRRLFSSEPGTAFALDADHCDGLSPRVAAILRGQHLRYRVFVITDHADWRSYVAAGLILFRIEAISFPTVHAISANNPDVV